MTLIAVGALVLLVTVVDLLWTTLAPPPVVVPSPRGSAGRRGQPQHDTPAIGASS